MKTSNEKQATCEKRTEPLKPGLRVHTALKAGASGSDANNCNAVEIDEGPPCRVITGDRTCPNYSVSPC
jgi:hypothetical protein